MTFNIKYLGENNSKLLDSIEEKIHERLDAGTYNQDEIKSIKNLGMNLLNDDVKISGKELDNLRTLCQLYNNKIQIQNISSHRKVIGPFIVIAKKFVLRIAQFALKDYINQQKHFNATIIKNIANLYNGK